MKTLNLLRTYTAVLIVQVLLVVLAIKGICYLLS